MIFVVAGPHFILLFVGGRFSLRGASFFLTCSARVCVRVLPNGGRALGSVEYELNGIESLGNSLAILLGA